MAGKGAAAAAHERAELDAIYDAVGEGILVLEMSGKPIFTNDAMARFGGYETARELLAAFTEASVDAPRYELRDARGAPVPPDRWPIARALRGEAFRELDLQVNRCDTGEVRWYSCAAQPVHAADGAQVLAVVVARDITARKRDEEALRESEERARARAAELQRALEERRAIEAELAVVVRLYAVLSQVNETIVRTRDAAALYRDVCRIVADEGGFPLVWVGLVDGRRVVPASAAGRAVAYLDEIAVDLDGPLGQGPTGVSLREDRPVVNDDFEVNPTTGPWRAAAQRHGLRASASFPLYRAGRPAGALVLYAATPGAFTPPQVRLLESLCADLSWALDALDQERLRTAAEAALREREVALREADRRKDDFLSVLSHELRNPLAPIRNAVQVLRRADPGSDVAARAMAIVERQADHMARLVDDLLDVTRIARGKAQLRKTRIELCEVARGAADDFRAALEARGVGFRVRLPDAPVWLHADRTRATQVIGNLLHNAAKFTREGDEVELAVEIRDGRAEIRVKDTGAGIEPALLPRLFDAFVQGPRTLARSEGGLGLGLALVKGIAELHGGTVAVSSAGPGHGSEFVVCLPLAPAQDGPSPEPPNPGAGGAPRRILVVDDNADAAESLSDLLRIIGHTVEVAHDGPTALGRARSNPPDVVLCDIGLPGMDGYEVARELRRTAATGSARLVAVSGYAQGEDRRRALEAGFDAHLAKPVDLPELMSVVSGER